jgi:hypothetical protein
MTKPQIQTEMRTNEHKLLGKYSFWSRLFILIIILLIIVLSIVFLGMYIFGYAYNWALLSLDVWIIVISLLCIIFILLELFFYYNFSSIVAKRIELHIYTHPKGAEGGVFGKTYIELDKKNILRIRSLIVPPDELWGNKEI